MPDAEVIPFPVTPMRRLESALQSLVKAQEEQRRAVQAFQDSVAQLRTQTTLLRESVRDFEQAHLTPEYALALTGAVVEL